MPRWLSIALVAGLLGAPACGSTARTPSAVEATGQVLPAPPTPIPGSPGASDAAVPQESTEPLSPTQSTTTPGGEGGASPVSENPSPVRSTGTPKPQQPAPLTGVIKIGIILEGAPIGQGLPANPFEPKEVRQVVEAVVDLVNDTGGLAGRRVEPVIVLAPNHGEPGRNAQEHQKICVQLTQDEDVFMVVSGVYSTVYAASCYASAHTPLLHTATLYTDEDFGRLAPWLLPDGAPSLTAIARLLPQALADSGFLADPSHRLGVVSWEADHMMNPANGILVPSLERLGANVEAVEFIPEPNYPQWAAGVASTILEFQQKGIDRVVFWDHGGTAREWLPGAEQAGYRPRYGFSSLTGGDLSANLSEIDWPKAQLRGAVGAGWSPGIDVPDEVFPLTPSERRCLAEVNSRLGTDHSARNPVDSKDVQSLVAIFACATAFLLQDALAPATGQRLAASQVLSLFHRLRDGHTAVTPPNPVFGKRLNSGSAFYAMTFFDSRDSACRTREGGCFRYLPAEDGKVWRPIPR